MNTRQLLDQDEVWITNDRMPLLLIEMEPSHRRNTLRFLRRRAHYLMKAYVWCEIREVLRFGTPEDDHDDAAGVGLLDDPEQWLERRPLIRELARLVHHDELEENTVQGEVVTHALPAAD